MILFPVLSVHFKTRAPGAKTFLQIIYARFGKRAHIVYCFFALLTNFVVMICLLVAGIATLQSMISNASPEFCVLLMATLFGSYSFVGGLGTTFYVSYFNAVLVFVILVVFIMNIFYLENPGDTKLLGSMDAIFKQVSCQEGPAGNEGRSYLTFWSEGAIIWGIQGVFATSSLTFCDQASWQSRIAAKPAQGVLGFFAATYIWFAIPSSIGTSTGLAYLALSSSNSSFALPTSVIDAGLVTPFIAETALGYAGGVMVLTMLTMALMSTGSGEVMAVSSIIVYDIYQTHINPYRKGHTKRNCLLCGKTKPALKNATTDKDELASYCECTPASDCRDCARDQKNNIEKKNLGGQKLFQCGQHGQFRRYQESLVQFKSWCILWVTLGIIPLGLLVNVAGIDLNWIMMVGFIITTPCFPGAVLSIVWLKTSAIGATAGVLSGLAGGLISLFSVASTFDGGLSNFLVNTSQNYSVVAGSSASFLVSLLVTIVLSLFTHKISDETDEMTEWEKLRDIDNPLNPWGELFKEDFPSLEGARPTVKQLDSVFRKAKLTAYVGGAVSLTLFIVILPSVMAALHVLTSSQFRAYLMTLQIWCFLMAAVVVVVAPLEEVMLIVKHIRGREKTENKSLINGGNRKPEGNEVRETTLL
ncbi:uncharacterized protein LOC124283788 [Haliotis rubra]|uniref:uncharacterized protein LOC124283788 n=1 Tax=Haliotis rubra TaxID=36100 RepID=UPI001EE58053|nr:uncharacterized protein LOC124283788 [Haliotis rubra]XP_046575768.1 uncharacterized protein LOC124283788 [Haliotis rubra]XP_046575769.1 uncharacterized protein LOC124283788 [Haliotis rubra]XP_046575770.1 uncharacterized protein LOC124283788 [Haliotis rubra]